MRTIEISDETYETIKDQLRDEGFELNCLDDVIGKKWFIRTVTNYWTGRCVGRVGPLMQLEDAAWIANTGRFMQAIQDGELDEVEPIGAAFVSIPAIIDMIPWDHDLPKEQK